MSKSKLLYIIAMAVSIIPPAAATLMYFPLWQARGGECVLSGLSLLLLVIAAVPVFKHLRQRLCTPAAYMVWFIIFIVFFLLSKIAEEVTVIAFCGFVSNLISTLLFGLSRRCK